MKRAKDHVVRHPADQEPPGPSRAAEEERSAEDCCNAEGENPNDLRLNGSSGADLPYVVRETEGSHRNEEPPRIVISNGRF